MTNKKLSKFFDKLFFKKWIIGICQVNIKDIIRSKNFDSEINWLIKKSFDKFYADPFPLISNDGNIKILYEEYIFKEDYGKISLMTIDKNFRLINNKTLLDTKSHLSYPFFFSENNKIYVFPESATNSKLSCYEYNPTNESLVFLKDILNIPLRDSTILKYDGKYWIFGAIGKNFINYKLSLFYSDDLLGTYEPHACNNTLIGLNGIRPAGNFIEVDGVLYRPAQNCNNYYGESITINKVNELNEMNFREEPYMTIFINKKRKFNRGMHSIHTINSMDNFIVVDGEHWTFDPIRQFKKFFKNVLTRSLKTNV
jgi:hypothetical protein